MSEKLSRRLNSKLKGKRYELEISHFFQDMGYPARRSAQVKGNTGDAADVEGVPHIHIECKRQERIVPYEWMAQAIRDSSFGDDKPVVFFRRSGEETLVLMRRDDWFEMYREWSDGLEMDKA